MLFKQDFDGLILAIVVLVLDVFGWLVVFGFGTGSLYVALAILELDM